MTDRIHGHARFREMISMRLDAPITPRDQRDLFAHLAGCADCRAVERDYREQRSRLRSLPAAPPPRDMWARTSTALDREMAGNGGYRPVADESGPSHGRRAAFTSLAAAGLLLALAASQLPQTAPPAGRDLPLLMATPFGVPSQALAFLGSNENGLALYRTRVDLVCPAAAPDCVYDDDIEPSIVALPRNLRPSNLALSPSGRQLAIVGRTPLEREDLIGVVTMPDDASGPDKPAVTPRTDLSPSTPAVLTSQPSLPAASGLQHPLTTAPPTDAIEGLTVLAIVEGVRSTGAPPAWSADGSMLAFSAMPADGSHGPDVYIWRPDDPLAQRVTNDHHSYFASWSDVRIVLSRVEQVEPTDPIGVETAVIDPRTGEERGVDAENLWLPAVSPLGRHAVSWFGSLEWKGLLASPLHGALYVADWTALDPFADRPAGEPSPAPSASPAGVQSPSPLPRAPAGDPTPTASAAVLLPGETARPGSSPGTDIVPGPMEPGPSASESAGPAPAEELVPPAWLTAVEPARDPQGSPVVDWQVRWSSDGKVLGYWVTDTPDASWGRLVVLALDPQTGIVDHDLPLLEPTLARRGFTLGLSRVAWVAPGESGTEGELRVRTWGLDGVGLLRLRRFELTEVMPAF